MTSDGPSLAVTGATGRVGGRVAHQLAEAGVAHRLVVRDPSRAPRLERAVVTRAEYADAQAAREALDGVDVLFMVSGAEAEDRVAQHRTFIDAAAEAGVRHVVYLSFFGAAPTCTFTLGRDHWATEQHLREGPLDWTFVRDNLYLEAFAMMAGPEGVVRGPAGDGRVAAVAIDDVADAVAAILQDPSAHRGTVHRLSGPQALTLHEMAAGLTRIMGRSVRYEEETIDEAYASRAHYGAPDFEVDAWVSTYTAIAAGELEEVTGDVERLTGRPARSIDDITVI